MFSFRERLAIMLLGKLKYDYKKDEVMKCKRNDFIIIACNVLRVDPDELTDKICKMLGATPVED